MALLVMLIAFVVSVLAAFNVALGSLNVVALGLALLTLAFIVGGGWPYIAKSIQVTRREP